jgi:hypothetical protein
MKKIGLALMVLLLSLATVTPSMARPHSRDEGIYEGGYVYRFYDKRGAQMVVYFDRDVYYRHSEFAPDLYCERMSVNRAHTRGYYEVEPFAGDTWLGNILPGMWHANPNYYRMGNHAPSGIQYQRHGNYYRPMPAHEDRSYRGETVWDTRGNLRATRRSIQEMTGLIRDMRTLERVFIGRGRHHRYR